MKSSMGKGGVADLPQATFLLIMIISAATEKGKRMMAEKQIKIVMLANIVIRVAFMVCVTVAAISFDKPGCFSLCSGISTAGMDTQ